MNVGEALLVFLGIPVAFAVLVYLAVSASSWTRSGRVGDVARVTGANGPLFLTSESAMPDPSSLPAEIGSEPTSFAGGGASGRW